MIPKTKIYKTFEKAVQALSTSIGIQGHSFRHHWTQPSLDIEGIHSS
ncbi:MAG: hypothetical protein JKX81_15520 [Arenicella sp.]|nr:hypothetical protein [Arenicella sp.]